METAQPLASDPTAATLRALAAIGFILGMIGIIIIPFALVPYFGEVYPNSLARRATVEIWYGYSTALGLPLDFALLVGAWGVMSFRPWGRHLLLLFCVVALVDGIVGLWFFPHWVFPTYGAQIAALRAEGPFGGFLAWAFGSIYAAVMLVFLLRPSVRDLFTGHWTKA